MTIGFSANGRSGSANVRARGRLDQFGWLVGVLPLIPGWILALALSPMATQRIAAFGVIAIVGAAGLGLLLWRFALRELATGDLALSRFLKIAASAGIATAVWVWLQYALNPFRVRTVLEALAIS